MGSSSKQTVGYWYRLALHFGLCRAPVDALLEMRVGDRTAWAGQVSSNTTLTVDQPELFGGTKSEGGLQGDMDVLMGAAGQGVNPYLAQIFGAEQGAYRGRVSVVWKGGRWGAMNPYPKPAAFKLRRASSSWYPAKAAIPLLNGGTEILPWAEGHDPRAPGNTHEYRVGTSAGPWYGSVEEVFAAAGWDIAGANAMLGWSPDRLQLSRAFPANAPGSAASLFLHFNRYTPETYYAGMDGLSGALVCANMFAEDIEVGGPRFWWNGLDRMGNTSPTAPTALQHQGVYRLVRYQDGVDPGEDIANNCTNYPSFEAFFPRALQSPDRLVEVRRTGRVFDVVGMNPAHILYDSIVDGDMLAEPAGAVDEASFIAAADRLFDEGFGLCTKYDPTQETIEDFQQRICNVAGLALSRDRRTGLWTLDMVRGAGDPGALPVLTDDDILDFAREPGAQDDAVNQVAVKWFDPLRKEERTAGPVQALGHIQAFGGVVSETVAYPEIPLESLALRVAARDLRNRATPLARLDLRTTRVAWAWRTGTYFRLQAPKRGIADMVCMVSEIDIGTLRQGAISLVAVQDVFSMPTTSYVVPQAPAVESGSTLPTVPPQQRVFEAPYASLAALLPPEDLAVVPADAGYLAAVASRPASGWSYALLTAGAGETLEPRGAGDWTPVCLAAAAALPLATSVAIEGASGLADLPLPVAALWDEEIVRVDTIDLVGGTLTLGRGCADTVPAAHAAGSVLFFFGAAVGSDERTYVDGEPVMAKVLSMSAGTSLPATSAPLLTATMAARQARPYPPARLRINGQAEPDVISGDVIVTWVHRDRVLQGDQLVDSEMSGVGPEAGTTYSGYLFDNVSGSLLGQQTGMTGTTWAPLVPVDLDVRVEVEAVRGGLASFQRQVRTFVRSAGSLLEEGGDAIAAEFGGLLSVSEAPAKLLPSGGWRWLHDLSGDIKAAIFLESHFALGAIRDTESTLCLYDDAGALVSSGPELVAGGVVVSSRSGSNGPVVKRWSISLVGGNYAVHATPFATNGSQGVTATIFDAGAVVCADLCIIGGSALDRDVWVSHPGLDKISVIDGAAESTVGSLLFELDVAGGPAAMAVQPNGHLNAGAATFTDVAWVLCASADEVVALHGGTGIELARWAALENATHIAVVGDRIIVGSHTDVAIYSTSGALVASHEHGVSGMVEWRRENSALGWPRCVAVGDVGAGVLRAYEVETGLEIAALAVPDLVSLVGANDDLVYALRGTLAPIYARVTAAYAAGWWMGDLEPLHLALAAYPPIAPPIYIVTALSNGTLYLAVQGQPSGSGVARHAYSMPLQRLGAAFVRARFLDGGGVVASHPFGASVALSEQPSWSFRNYPSPLQSGALVVEWAEEASFVTIVAAVRISWS